MKSKNRKQAQILRELENNPLVERACKKVGIARSTYYRWCEADSGFDARSKLNQEKGRAKLTDFVESKLLENIGNNQYASIAYWLSHNTERYRPNSIKAQIEYMNEVQRLDWMNAELFDHLINMIGLDEFLKHIGEKDLQTYKQKMRQEYMEQQKNKYIGPKPRWISKDSNPWDRS